MEEWCTTHGIHHESSAPYSQWQNGIVERMMQTLWEGSEAMRKHAAAPESFWPLTLLAFAYTRNRMAMGERDESPHEPWNDIKVPLRRRIGHLRTWGSRCYSLVPKDTRRKTDDKAKVCVHVGYSSRCNGYLLLDPDEGELFVSTSVMFDETRLHAVQRRKCRAKPTAGPGPGTWRTWWRRKHRRWVWGWG